MRTRIPDLLPDAGALLELEPEELAGPLLHYLASLPDRDRCLLLSQLIPQHDLDEYPDQRRFSEPDDLKAFRKQNLLPRQQLQPRIAQTVWATFLRGDYDTAVFQAFKEVEVAVREAGRFSDLDLGTDLMRKAFAPGDGPLSDPTALPGEQEALSHLFAGAIGSYKNPHSHRNVSIVPIESVEMIVLGG